MANPAPKQPKQAAPDLQKQMQQAMQVQQERQAAAKRKSWAKERADWAEAKALSVLDVEDDLPLSRHMLLLFIALFFIIFIIWANLAPLDEVTRGEGKVIPSSEVQSIQSLDAGIIEAFMVKKGDEVKAGQVLVRLSDVEASSDLGANNARYLGLLAAITRLQAEAEGKTTISFPENVMKGAPTSVTEEMNAFRANQLALQNQLNILQQQLAQREQEVRELETRISDTRGVVRLQQQEMEMVRPLVEKGSAPKMELLQLERTLKEKNTELNGYLSSLPRAKSAIGEVRARLEDTKSTAKAQAQTELTAKQIEMNEIKERLGALKDRKTRTEIKSPVNGTIQDITINTVGGVVRPGEDFIKVVPKDDQLIVEAKIKPKDRAFIYPGQKAVIKITAYDYSIYGGLEGELVDISADTFEDEKQNTYYKVRLRTKETEIKHNGEVLPITIGMVASVDILTGKKTVMEYLLKPLIKTLDSAMNER
ncbi:MAG: HlyD family type I secretion periplasmic adaptor subunit [Alphaproteobacteria bacterium]|nr:HlyD family type I secretion periplasmic adaptor subunit [Alphaproteobacteria bacterium]